MPNAYGPMPPWRMTMADRLRAAREKIYPNAADAARALGIPYPTYVAHENGSRGFKSHLALYAQSFNVSVEYLLTGRVASSRKGTTLSFVGEKMPVRGFVRAGVWQEAYHTEGDTSLPITSDTRHAGRAQYALEIQGESMNRRFTPGEYAICAEWDGKPKVDDVVVVEKRRHGQFEATIKVIRVMTKDRLELWPDSNHADHQTPLVIRASDVKDGEEIAIVARVIGAYRKV